jgi:hypothetical protein
VEDLAEEARVDASEIREIWARGSTTEEEAYRAARAVVERLPDELREQGKTALEFGWPDHG